MEKIEKGKPVNAKNPLVLGDFSAETVKITITVPKDLHKKIKQEALDTDKGVLELVTDTVIDRWS